MAQPVTLQIMFGWINAPFAWLMGVPANDCLAIGGILGERIVLNEFIGYLSLTNPKTVVDERSFIAGDLRAVRLREFLQHRDPGGRHRLARARAPRRHGPARRARDDRRIAGELSDGDALRGFCCEDLRFMIDDWGKRTSALLNAAIAGVFLQ